MKHARIHISDWLIALVKFLHLGKTLDFSGDNTIGDDIPYVFLK